MRLSDSIMILIGVFFFMGVIVGLLAGVGIGAKLERLRGEENGD